MLTFIKQVIVIILLLFILTIINLYNSINLKKQEVYFFKSPIPSEQSTSISFTTKAQFREALWSKSTKSLGNKTSNTQASNTSNINEVKNMSSFNNKVGKPSFTNIFEEIMKNVNNQYIIHYTFSQSGDPLADVNISIVPHIEIIQTIPNQSEIIKIKASIYNLNKRQQILNLDKYGNLTSEDTVIVIQVIFLIDYNTSIFLI